LQAVAARLTENRFGVNAISAGVEPTAGCPKCGALCISRVSSGGKRCANCGHQFDEPDMTPTHPQNRAGMLAGQR
jgi:ribosomal protein L37AE/L43A